MKKVRSWIFINSIKQTPHTRQISENVFQTSDLALGEESQKYLRTIISLQKRAQVLVPRNKPHQRLLDFGIIPKSKYTLDVYLEIALQFSEGKNPDQIVDHLKSQYTSLLMASISREFVKKAIQLLSLVVIPEMITLVPKDGNWTLMIDGMVRTKYDDVLIIIAAVPLDVAKPHIIPLVVTFLPSENTKDVLQLLYELKPRLPSLPRSVLSDLRVGLLEAIGEVFPNSTIQGCHFHMLELIATILIHPLIKKIKKKLRGAINGINRWAHHSIYGKKSEHLVLVARSLQKVVTSNHGKFGVNFLEFCRKLQHLTIWIEDHSNLLKSDSKYQDLVKFLDTKLWRQLAPQLSQLEFVLKEFNLLRKCLTMQEYKTEIVEYNGETDSTIPFDQLIHDWIKLAEMNKKSIFHKRFKRSVKTLTTHYDLLTPAILDHSLPRTNSILENLNGQIKHFIRKWSGSMKLRRTFQWAAPLAAISQSLKETGLFHQILDKQTGYDWIEKTQKLAKKMSQYRFQIHFANSIASKTPEGLVSMIANLIIRDLIS